MSLQQLSKLSGVHIGTLKRMESDKVGGHLNSYLKISKAYDMPPSQLFLALDPPSGKKMMSSEWRAQASEDERELDSLMLDFEEEYFEDLTFEKFQKSDLTKVTLDSGECFYSEIPELYSSLSLIPGYTIKVEEPSVDEEEKAVASCDMIKNSITFYKGRYEEYKEETLLHEMIHAYDEKLSRLIMVREFLLLDIYEHLCKRIGKKKLRECIYCEIHPDVMINHGHNLLFLLKSFDLDIRRGIKLGSVFAYGREERFGKISYK
jgi:transcriptional regulator with XRE-family HTH domain